MASACWRQLCSLPCRGRACSTCPASATKAASSSRAIRLTTPAGPRPPDLLNARREYFLRNPANSYRAILINAIEPGNPRLLHHYPTRAICFFQSREVLHTETPPWSLHLHLCPPFLSQHREHAYRPV